METKKLWWTLEEVQQSVFSNHLSRSTIIRMIKSGEIPAKRFGVRRLFVPDYWVQQQIQEATDTAV